jgi:hypothetical protein
VGLLNPGGPIAQFERNRCSIWPVEVISRSGVRSEMKAIYEMFLSGDPFDAISTVFDYGFVLGARAQKAGKFRAK